MFSQLKYLLIATIIGVMMLCFNTKAQGGSSNFTDAQFQAGRACEAMAKVVGFTMNLQPGTIIAQGSSDNPDGSYLCFIQQGNRILARIVADPTGKWGEPY